MKLAFLGLGTMGAPMAARLAAAGHELAVFNRSTGRVEAWLQHHGGRRAATPALAAAGAEIVFSCVTADSDTQAVAAGPDGAFEAMTPGAIFVDHGSGSPDAARGLDREARRRGLSFVDAPVTGGRPGAEAGTLSVLAGGDADAVERARPAMQAYAKTVTLMGPSGAGHLTKLVNVIIGHGNGVALAEGLAFAERAGLEPSRVVEALIGGSSRSWHMEHRSRAMIERDYATLYPVAFARKDLGNVLAEAGRIGARLPLSALADELYAGLERAGGGACDVASLMEAFPPAPAGETDDET